MDQLIFRDILKAAASQFIIGEATKSEHWFDADDVHDLLPVGRSVKITLEYVGTPREEDFKNAR